MRLANWGVEPAAGAVRWTREHPSMRAYSSLLVIGGLVLLLATGAPPEAEAQKKKKKGAAPASGPINPIGRPTAFAAGQPGRLAVWFDDDVWHIRATSKKGVQVIFQGRVEVDEGTILYQGQALDKAKAGEDADWVLPLPKKRGFVFQIVTKGAVDGFSFKASPEVTHVRFKFLTNGDDDAKRIFIGAKGRHPEKETFTLPARPMKSLFEAPDA
jgi:hypothetical protein